MSKEISLRRIVRKTTVVEEQIYTIVNSDDHFGGKENVTNENIELIKQKQHYLTKKDSSSFFKKMFRLTNKK